MRWIVIECAYIGCLLAAVNIKNINGLHISNIDFSSIELNSSEFILIEVN